MSKSGFFGHFAQKVAHTAGHPVTFVVAVAVVIVWAAMGPIFGFTNAWQLVINTSTTIITFLMVFVIQNTQNRGDDAMQAKLDELIRVTKGAHNALLDLEELPEKQLRAIKQQYEELASKAREELERGNHDTNRPQVKNEAEED